MAASGAGPQSGAGQYGGAWIDTCIHYHWSSQQEIVDFMSAGWAEYVGHAGTLPDGGGAISILPRFPFARPGGDRPGLTGHRMQAPELASTVLGNNPANAGLLVHEAARLTPALPNAIFADEIARAVNDWTVERWLSGGDQRLHGLVLVANQLPELAAREIRRIGTQQVVI